MKNREGVEVKETKDCGNALFAIEDFKKDNVILTVYGRIFQMGSKRTGHDFRQMLLFNNDQRKCDDCIDVHTAKGDIRKIFVPTEREASWYSMNQSSGQKRPNAYITVTEIGCGQTCIQFRAKENGIQVNDEIRWSYGYIPANRKFRQDVWAQIYINREIHVCPLSPAFYIKIEHHASGIHAYELTSDHKLFVYDEKSQEKKNILKVMSQENQYDQSKFIADPIYNNIGMFTPTDPSMQSGIFTHISNEEFDKMIEKYNIDVSESRKPEDLAMQWSFELIQKATTEYSTTKKQAVTEKTTCEDAENTLLGCSKNTGKRSQSRLTTCYQHKLQTKKSKQVGRVIV